MNKATEIAKELLVNSVRNFSIKIAAGFLVGDLLRSANKLLVTIYKNFIVNNIFELNLYLI